jgi:hypothetical protein
MIVMCDLEGTLSDHTDRLAVLKQTIDLDPKNRDAWKTYYQGLANDVPREHVIEAVIDWIKSDEVVIYSTRFQNKYNGETAWLHRHNLWGSVELLLRNPGDRITKGPQLVAIWASELKPKILVDDREEVRTLVRMCCPDTIVMGVDDLPR